MTRNALVQLTLVLLGVTSVHAVKLLQTASIRAKISPAGGAEKIWVIRGRDSVKMASGDGIYYLTTLPAGNWRIWIDAKKPYHDMDMQIPGVKAGLERDLGEIQLRQ